MDKPTAASIAAKLRIIADDLREAVIADQPSKTAHYSELIVAGLQARMELTILARYLDGGAKASDAE